MFTSAPSVGEKSVNRTSETESAALEFQSTVSRFIRHCAADRGARGDFWLLIPGPARRGTLHYTTKQALNTIAAAWPMKPTQNISTNWYVTKDTRFKEGLSGMSLNRHLLPDQCYVSSEFHQTGRATDGTRS